MEIRFKKVAIAILLLFTYLLSAQNTFSKKIHYGVHDNLSQYIQLYNDTFYMPVMVANHTQPSPSGTSLLRMDINGNIVPQTFYSPLNTSITSPFCYYKSNSDKFYVNAVVSHGSDVRSALVIFNKLGDTLAFKVYGDTTYWNYMEWIIKKRNDPNKLLLFGVSDSICGSIHSSYCHSIIKIVDTLGNLLSTKSYFTNSFTKTLQNVDTTNDGGYIFSGFEQQSSNGTGEAYIMKLDSNLNQVWLQYSGSCGSVIPSIVALKNGANVLAYSSMDSVGANSTYFAKIALLKLDKNGAILWTKKYGGLESGGVSSNNIKELPNGDLITCGITSVQTTIPGIKQTCGFILKTDSNGNQKWLQTYKITNPNDLNGQNYLYHILPMADGGYTAVGYVETVDTSAQLTWVLRVDSMGCLTPGCIPMESAGIEKFVDNNVQISTYPNPFNNELTVSVVLPESPSEAILQLIEPVTGKVIFSKEITHNKEHLKFQTTSLASGIYGVILIENGFTRKFVKTIKVL